VAVKRSTAVGHLREMAQSAQDGLRLRDADIGWPLEELWVTGELLDRVETLDAGTVVLSLDLPADELPWLAKHPTAEWIGSRLRLGKRPFWWFYRPLVWPAWNPAHRRVLRFWSATGGLDDRAIEALADRRLGDLTVVEPSAEIRREQLEVELAVSRRHLWEVLDHYRDQDWPRRQDDPDHQPEDQLWRAAQGVREIEAGLAARP